jgi:hypothetical protein
MKWKIELIKIFGSLTNAMTVLGLSPQAHSKWIKYGVPFLHHEKLIAEAKERGFKLTPKQLRTK